jgi:hypothetical protein
MVVAALRGAQTRSAPSAARTDARRTRARRLPGDAPRGSVAWAGRAECRERYHAATPQDWVPGESDYGVGNGSQLVALANKRPHVQSLSVSLP